MQEPAAGGLVGRERELQVLLDALGNAHSGRSHGAVVLGEPGIGKSRLVDELLDWATREGDRVVRGSADAAQRNDPFACALALLGEHVHVPRAVAGAAQEERHRVRRALLRSLEEYSEDRPVVLALDQLANIDEASAELFAHLLKDGVRGSLLLVLELRPHGAPDVLMRAAHAAVRDGRADVVELGPLTIEHAAALVDGAAPGTVQFLYDQSGGNPRYLVQLARAADMSEVPEATQSSLARELARVSPDARRLAEAAAVLGDRFDPLVAARVAEMETSASWPALDELIASGVARPTDLPRRFQFHRPIVGRALYAAIPEERRRAAHGRAAAALGERMHPAQDIAPHVEQSADHGDETAIDLLVQAAASAARAPDAARWYESALGLVGDGPDAAARRGELLLALAQARAAMGDVAGAQPALREVLALRGPEAAPRRVKAAVLLARLEAFTGEAPGIRDTLAEMLDAADAESVSERASLSLELSVAYLREGDAEQAAQWGAQAVAHAVRADRHALLGGATAALASAELTRGAVLRARELERRGAPLVDGLTERELSNELVALFDLACAASGLGRHHDAGRRAERGRAVAQAAGIAPWSVLFGLVRGWSQVWLGRLDDAAEQARAALDAACRLGIDQCLSWSWTLFAWVSTQRGDVAAGTAAAERAVATRRARWGGLVFPLSHCALAQARLAAGEPDDCRRQLLAGAGGEDLPEVALPVRARWYRLLTEAELALGRHEAAHEWLARAHATTDSVPLPSQHGAAAHANALVLLAEDEPVRAARAGHDAAQAFARQDLRVDSAAALTTAGQAHAGAGEVDRGVAALESAYRRLDDCGAILHRDAAARALRQLGRRAPARSRKPARFASLSAREREIAEHIADGLTNRDIGALLHLSERTIEGHVTQVLRKLGVSSRAAVAREVTRSGSSRGHLR